MGAEHSLSNAIISDDKRAKMHASLVMSVISEQENNTERIIQCASTASSNAIKSPFL